MNRPSKIAIIGCGGIACHLVPSLSRLAPLVLVDGDKYEPKNVTRQFPALKSKDNKAKVLAEMIRPNTTLKIEVIEEFFKNHAIIHKPEWAGVDMVVGCVDNNASRHIMVEVCSDLHIPAILGGNDHASGEAHLFVPGIYNPMDHFSFPDTDPTPWSCNADQAIEEHPQTPMANFMAASAIMHILLAWEKSTKIENTVAHSRLDVFFSASSRIKNILASPTPTTNEHPSGATKQRKLRGNRAV